MIPGGVQRRIVARQELAKMQIRVGKMRAHEGLFLREAVRTPFSAGAVLPSGPDLARAMAAEVDPGRPGLVLELGPGTGTVTNALVERGVHPSRLVLLETNAQFCGLLREAWPQASVLQRNAYEAPALIRELAVPVCAVVSSLPLILEARSRRLRFVAECLEVADDAVPFIQFTYFFRSPVQHSGTILRSRCSRMIWRNVWPARVWTYRRRRPSQQVRRST